ncbi:MAG TPA: hypothetical protein VFN61_08035 [Acidimicrobiales bacterium]|nr:hypothetical protein [Acidimicrobiales bacterium]
MPDVNPWQPPAQQPEGPGSGLPEQWPVPAGAGGAGPIGGEHSTLTEPVPPHSPPAKGRGRLLGAAALAVVLVGGGAGASVALSSGSGGGASTPSQAVDNMLQAIQSSDVIGVMDDLAPGERNAIAPGLQDVFGQLKRIGVLDSTADLQHITGFSASFHGYSTSTRQINSSLAAVTLTGGSSAASLDPNQLPLGSYFKSLAVAATTGQVQKSSSSMGPSTFATVQVGGSWYVSLGYSIAINALQSAGKPMTPPAGAIIPAGADSPQDAVTAMFTSVSNLDLQSLIADLDPGEMAALDAYAPLFIGPAQRSLDTAKGQVSISFDLPTMRTEQISSGTLVKLGGLGVHIKTASMSIDAANGCETIVMSGHTVHTCGAAAGLGNGSATGKELVQAMPAPVRPILQRFIDNPPDAGIVTSEVNGKWYLSPTRALLQAVNAYLADLKPGDIQTVIANAHGVDQGFMSFLNKEGQAVMGATSPLLGATRQGALVGGAL